MIGLPAGSQVGAAVPVTPKVPCRPPAGLPRDGVWGCLRLWQVPGHAEASKAHPGRNTRVLRRSPAPGIQSPEPGQARQVRAAEGVCDGGGPDPAGAANVPL